jgi:hypothetical protein
MEVSGQLLPTCRFKTEAQRTEPRAGLDTIEKGRGRVLYRELKPDLWDAQLVACRLTD